MRVSRPLPHRIIILTCALTGVSAERLRFDTVLDGKALQANLSGIPYGRFFTP